LGRRSELSDSRANIKELRSEGEVGKNERVKFQERTGINTMIQKKEGRRRKRKKNTKAGELEKPNWRLGSY